MVNEEIKVVGDAIKIFGAQNEKKAAVIYQEILRLSFPVEFK